MEDSDFKAIEMKPIGFIQRLSSGENVKDRNLVSRIVFTKDLAPALDGIESFSHIFVICWFHEVAETDRQILHHPGNPAAPQPLGILATRAPIRPNPIGLTLVELVKREENILWVRGLDAVDNTPVLDIKPYPDWEQGRFPVVADFRVPEWLARIVRQDDDAQHP